LGNCRRFSTALRILTVVGAVGALTAAASSQTGKNQPATKQPVAKKSPAQPVPAKKAGQPNRKLVAPARIGAQQTKGIPVPGPSLTPNSKFAPAVAHGIRGGGNDECTAPTVVTGSPAVLNFDNNTATQGTSGQGNNACLFFGLTAIDLDEWFLWTATGTGTATLTACGTTTVDTKCAVYSGSACPPGAPIACNDDTCALQSQLTFACSAGQQYLIQIGTYPGEDPGTGSFTLTGPGGGGGPANDNCGSGQAISEGTFAYDTTSATNDGTASCGASATTPDVWFTYTPSLTGAATVSTCGQTTHDSVVSVLSGCGGAQIGCNDDNCGGTLQSSLTFPVISGSPVRIRVAGFNGATGAGSIVVSAVGITGNDNCANAQVVTGNGPFAFENGAATTDGNPDPLCLSFGTDQIEHDVWFTWTAGCNAGEDAIIDVCNQTTVDTRIAIYDGGCGGPIVACNDDSCGLQSRARWTPTPGNQYTIRLGTFPGADGGSGTFSIACAPVVASVCTGFNPASDCQDPSYAIAYNITTFTAAESFTSNAPVTDMCVRGLYFNNTPVTDSWLVTVYTDAGNGVPGTQVDQFTQGVDLTVAGPAPYGQIFVGRDVYEWHFTFPRPIQSAPGTCMWVSLQNFATGDTVFIMDGNASNGNQQAAQDLNQNGTWESPAEVLPNDLSICINSGFANNALCAADPCAGIIPANDECAAAVSLSVGQTVHGTTQCSTVDAVITCSGAPAAPGVWYSFTGTGNTMTADLCASVFYDTIMEVFCGDCSNLVCVGGNDDTCGLQSSVSTCTQAGATYYVLVHGFNGAQGEFDITLTDDATPCGNAPDCTPCTGITVPGNAVNENEACGSSTNDGCNLNPNAFEVVTCDAVIHGTSYAEGGTRDTDWFRVVAPASGNVGVTVNAEFPVVVYLLDIPNGDCAAITLVAGDAAPACGTVTVSGSGLVPGNNYYVFVSTGTAASPIFTGIPCDADYVATFNLGTACTPPCPCNFNNDASLNSQDFFDFIACFFTPGCPQADYNHDNNVNSQDFFDFLSCFFAPPVGCP